MRLDIDHSLTLTLPDGTGQAVLHLLLTPGSGAGQQVESWSVEAAGIGNAGRFTDAYGNMVHLVNHARVEGEIVLRARGVVNTVNTNGVLGKPGGEPVPALYKRMTPLTKAPVTLYGKFRNGKDSRLDILHALMARVGEALGLPDEGQAQGQMQANGAQVQMQANGAQVQVQGDGAQVLPPAADYAHLFIGAARALDIPARYVTGYLGGAEGLSGPHAWAEAYDEGLGWIGFDARRQLCPTEDYVRLAIGLDADSAAPLRAVPVGELVQVVSVKKG